MVASAPQNPDDSDCGEQDTERDDGNVEPSCENIPFVCRVTELAESYPPNHVVEVHRGDFAG